MSNFDRFETPYHEYHFPDQQEKIVMEYSTCSGCGEQITETEVIDGDILDVYGMAIHDDFDCLKKAVEAKTIHI
ncbi:MAG: hypothetical protein ACQEXX_01055 [Bacillota bacterium]